MECSTLYVASHYISGVPRLYPACCGLHRRRAHANRTPQIPGRVPLLAVAAATTTTTAPSNGVSVGSFVQSDQDQLSTRRPLLLRTRTPRAPSQDPQPSSNQSPPSDTHHHQSPQGRSRAWSPNGEPAPLRTATSARDPERSHHRDPYRNLNTYVDNESGEDEWRQQRPASALLAPRTSSTTVPTPAPTGTGTRLGQRINYSDQGQERRQSWRPHKPLSGRQQQQQQQQQGWRGPGGQRLSAAQSPFQQSPQQRSTAGTKPGSVAVEGGSADGALGAALQTGLALTWLGTNSGSPTLDRNVSCTLVRLPGVVHMVDCGEGTHRQLQALSGLELAEVDGIFITHLHGDHCFGLGAALELLDRAKYERQSNPARRRNHVYGPVGLAELLRASLLPTSASHRLRLPLQITELVVSPTAAHGPRPLLQTPQQQQQQQQQPQTKDSQSQPQSQSQTKARATVKSQPPTSSSMMTSTPTTSPSTSLGGGSVAVEGQSVAITVQRLAARRVEEAPDLQSAVRVIGPRVAGLRNIYYPPGPHYHRGNPSRSGLYGVTSDEVYDHLDENDMGDPDTEGSDDSDGEEYGRSYGFVRQPRAIAVAVDGIFWEIPGCAGVRVRAAQLQHRVPCWGYTFLEAVPYEGCSRRRKVVVLGDTVSSRPIAPLAAGCDVLVHEATFAAGMEDKARAAQHSTGWMAGAFAAAVGARSLVLSHFSARYRDGPRAAELPHQRISRATPFHETREQAWAVVGLLREAADTYGRHDNIFAAFDFYTHHVPLVATGSASAAAGEGAGTGGRAGAGREAEEEEEDEVTEREEREAIFVGASGGGGGGGYGRGARTLVPRGGGSYAQQRLGW